EVARPARLVAEAVDAKLDPDQPHRLDQIAGEGEDLHVFLGRGHAEGFDAELEKLPVAMALGPLAAEHRAEVPPALHGIAHGQALLHVGPHRAGGILRPERQHLPAAILESVHLLADDVGLLADRPGEEPRFLEDRRVDELEAVAREHLASGVQDPLPDPAVERRILPLRGGEDVLHPFDCADLHVRSSSLELTPIRSPIRTGAPGTSRGSSWIRPGSKSRITVLPISKTAISSPLATGIGVS